MRQWLLAVVVATFGCVTMARADDAVSLRLNFQLLGFHAPFYAGVARGYYKAQGIDLTIYEGRGGGITAQAIGAGSDTFGIVDGGTEIVSIARGIPIRTVMSLMNSSIFAVVFRADAGINTAQDLVGKTIAATAGDALTQLWPAVLTANKLAPDAVRLVYVDPAAKVVTVLQHRTDALFGSIDAQTFQLEAQGAKAASLSFAEMGVNTVGLTVVASEDTIRTKPGLIRRFAIATTRSFQDAMADPRAAADAVAAQKPEQNAATLAAQLKVSLGQFPTPRTKGKPIGWGSVEDWADTLALLKQYQDVKTDRAASSLFTNEFLP